MNNNSNDKLYKHPIYHQSHYNMAAPPSPQHPAMHYIDPQYAHSAQPMLQQYNPQYIPSSAQRKSYLQSNHYVTPSPVVQKSASSLDDIMSAANSLHHTPSVTPDSSLGAMHVHTPYHHNIIDNHSAHSAAAATTTNLLPSIKYYRNQHSNQSNTSNSTYVSSTATAQSSLPSSSQGYSDHGSMPSIHPHFDISPASHSNVTQSDIQLPVRYHPYEAPPLYHYRYQHSHEISAATTTAPAPYPPQMIACSTTSTPNINIMELDQMNNGNSVMAKIEDEKHPKVRSESEPLPNAHSNSVVAVHQRTTTKQLELKHFNGEVRAYNIWIGCIRNNIHAAFFYELHPKLCEYFMDITGSPRCPTQNELRSAFVVHGAEANKYKNDENTYLSIDKRNFVSFWSWFKECCLIIKELRYLWDHCNISHHSTRHSNKRKACVHYGLGLNFFCQRHKCETQLLQSADGTFTLRLSASVSAGVVLSYVEPNYVADINHKKMCKHVILIRQRDGHYLCNKKLLSLHDIIRNFVKLKYLYTPSRSILKNKIF